MDICKNIVQYSENHPRIVLDKMDTLEYTEDNAKSGN